jgi:hypothetical protein
MSTFCGRTTSIPAFTPTELRAIYPNGFLPASLPSMPNGLASEQTVQTYVQQLIQQGRVSEPGKVSELASNPFGAPEGADPLKVFVTKENAMQAAMKAEYCFYEARYFSALDSFLTTVSDASLRSQVGDTANVQSKLEEVRQLNQKLIYLTQIVNGIAKHRYASSSSFQTEINSLNQRLKERQTKLTEHNEILNRESAAADLHKRMVEYTVEKNKANTNLLTLYGVLNIVALSMIFYIART